MNLARRYAASVVRLRWFIVGGWIVFAVALSVLLPTLESSGGTGGLGGFAAPGNPAIQAEIRSFTEFGFPVITRTAVVQRNPDGLPPATQFRIISNAIEFNLDRPPELRRIEFALPVFDNLVSSDITQQPTTAITYLFYRPDVSFGRQTGLAAEYAGRYASGPEDYRVGVTGVIPGRVAQLVLLRRALDHVELATIVLILLVVALNFRAVGAPLVTLATAAVALSVIVRLAGWIGQTVGVDVPSEIEPVIVALLLGIVTDYSIFFMSGMRERLIAGDEPTEAAMASTEEFAPIVLVAGVTVAAGSLALLAARVGLFRTFGPGMAITILISVAVAVTFVPASLAILGHWVFWPRLRSPARPGAGKTARSRLVEFLIRRRNAIVVAVAGVAVLLVAALPVSNLRLGFAVFDSLPPHLEARRAAEAAAEGFAPGILSPTVVLVEGKDIGRRRDDLEHLQALLGRQPGVAFVAGPANQPTRANIGAVIAPSGDAARYVLVFDAPPVSAATIENLEALRDNIRPLMAEAGLPDGRVSFAGDTALAASTVTQTKADLGRVALVATALGFVLLVVFLRAVIAPIGLMALNLLAVTAAVGVTTFVFESLAGASGLTFYVPFAAAVLLVALGADYSIFGVGYIWAEARHRPLVDAIRTAVPRSTRAITAAGVTLALSFALLAIVPLRPFREFALAMSVGILFDVFVVRSLLVPSLISLVGTASGWPGRALRWQPSPAGVRPPSRREPPAPPGKRWRRRLGSATWIAVTVGAYLLERRRRRRKQ